MNKIKVAFVSATTRKGGAERMLFNIMNTLDDRHEIQLYITSKDVVPSFVANKFRVVRFGKKHAKAALWQLLLNLKKSHPQYVFTTSSNIGYLLIMIRWMLQANFKVFIRCAVPPVEVYHHSLKTRFLSCINRWLYKGCDLMIAQTEFMRQDLMRAYHMRPDQVRVIRNIIDKAYIDRSIASEEIICLPNGFNFVASGMLYSVKGFDLLIEAIAPIVKRHRNVFLSILGEERYETGYRDFLQSKIDALGMAEHVRLVGYKENPYPYYKAANVFVMSSRKEGFPNVVLEALYLKTPVIATDCVDFTGVIQDGVNGFIVPKDNVAALSDALQKALSYQFRMDVNQVSNFDYNTLFA
mgnify:CR=1 FL=1